MTTENKKETAITNWDEELAKQAIETVKQESHVGVGDWVGTKGGRLVLPSGAEVPGNAMACIILDALVEYQYYVGKYNSDSTSPPLCFSIGRDEPTMRPHDITIQNNHHQSETCKACKYNEWGSADTGKGKACKNVRRLAVMVAGSLGENGKAPFAPFTAQEIADASIYLIKVPVTSVINYAQYVRLLAESLQRPPYGIITKLHTSPDDNTIFKMSFHMLAKLETSLLPTIMMKREAAMEMLAKPHLAFEGVAPPKPDGAPNVKPTVVDPRNPKTF